MRKVNSSLSIVAILFLSFIVSSLAFAATADINVQIDCSAVGDGLADDTAALQACISTAQTTGQAVYFPAGKYKITSALAITADSVTLHSTNNATATIVQHTPSADVLILSKPNPANVINQVTIRGLEMYYASQYPTGAVITCRNCWRTKLLNLNVGPTDVNFPGYYFYNIGVDANDGGLVYVQDSIFTGAVTAAMIFTNVDEVNVTGVQINNDIVPTVGAVGIILDGDTGGSYVTNVNITGGHTAVLIRDTFPKDGGKRPTFGFFTHVLADNQTGVGWNFDAARYMRLTNCWAASAGFTGIVVGSDVHGLSINDSRLINSVMSGISVASGAEEIEIKNSFIAGNSRTTPNTYAGIEISAGVSDFQIQNNKIGESGGANEFQNTQLFGIRIAAGNSNDYVITGNDLSDNFFAAIWDAGTGTNKIVKDNLF